MVKRQATPEFSNDWPHQFLKNAKSDMRLLIAMSKETARNGLAYCLLTEGKADKGRPVQKEHATQVTLLLVNLRKDWTIPI